MCGIKLPYFPNLPGEKSIHILVFAMILCNLGLTSSVKISVGNSGSDTMTSSNSFCQSRTVERIDYRIVNVYPHSADAFTQGLFYENGFLYESTGRYGMSSLRKVELKTGSIVQMIELPSHIFGEGIASYKDKIFQLTWFANVVFIYDKRKFELKDQFHFPEPIEGWGLAFDGKSLILSDGTDRLYFLDPENFEIENVTRVFDNKGPVFKINELEFIENQIFANVWQSEKIIRIDPTTGLTTGCIDLSELRPEEFRNHPDNVLNGIAFNPENEHMYVTGKMWPRLYEIELLYSISLPVPELSPKHFKTPLFELVSTISRFFLYILC